MTLGGKTWGIAVVAGALLVPAITGFVKGEEERVHSERRLVPNLPTAMVSHLLLTDSSLYVTTRGNSVLEYGLESDVFDQPGKYALPSQGKVPRGSAQSITPQEEGDFVRFINSGSLNETGTAQAFSSAFTQDASGAKGLITVQFGTAPGRAVYFPAGKGGLGKVLSGVPSRLLTVNASADGSEALAVSHKGDLALLGANGEVKGVLANPLAVLKSQISLEFHPKSPPIPFASCNQSSTGWVCVVNRPLAVEGGEALIGIQTGRKLENPKVVILAKTSQFFTAGNVSRKGGWCAAALLDQQVQLLGAASFVPSSAPLASLDRYVTAMQKLNDGADFLAATWKTGPSHDGKGRKAEVLRVGPKGSLKGLLQTDASIEALALNEASGNFACATVRGRLVVASAKDGSVSFERGTNESRLIYRVEVSQGDSGLVIHYSDNPDSQNDPNPVEATGAFDLGRMRLSEVARGKRIPLRPANEGLIRDARYENGSVFITLSNNKRIEHKTSSPPDQLAWKDDIYSANFGDTIQFWRVKPDLASLADLGYVYSPGTVPVASSFFTNEAKQDWAVVTFRDQSVATYLLSRDDLNLADRGASLSATIILWLGSERNWFSVEPKTGKFAGTPEAIKNFGYSVYDESTGEVRFVSAEQLQDQFLDASYVSQVAQGKSQVQALALSASQAAAKAGYVEILSVLGPGNQDLREFQDPESGMNAFQTSAMEVTVRVTASDGLAKENIRVSNGISAKSSGGGLAITGPERGNEFDLPVRLYPGDNHVRVYAAGEEAQASGETILIKCTAPMTPDSNVWNVLVVAIPEYDDPSYRGLPPVANDGKAVREAFESVKDSTAVFKVTKVEASETTRDKLDAKVKSFLSTVKPGENLLIYASAHGDREGEDFYLITKDAKHKDLKNTAVSWNQVSEEIQKKSTRNALIILDACHSGEAIDDQRAMLQVSRNAGDAVAIWASSSASEESYTINEKKQLEAIKSPAGIPVGGMSVFTIALVEGLKGHRFRDYYKDNWDGVVDLRRLHLLVGLRVIDISGTAGLPNQTPMIWGPSSNVTLMNLKGAS